jgi:hypothetical protein
MYSTGSTSGRWTVEEAQRALGEVACELLFLVDLLEAVHRGLPRPADMADREEGRKPYDCATDVLATIECVLEDELRPAVASLQRSAQVTDAELAQEFREWQRRVAPLNL